MAVTGGLLGDRYRVERKLGEGGMAEVFLVEDTLEKRRLALKRLKAGEPNREYFAHEFRVLARLDHPNLVRVFDYGDTDGAQSFYTCEFLEGVDLFKATRDADWDDLFEVVRQVLEALGYIHDRGLVHYDVKPENVNVAVRPPARPGARRTFDVKLVDFGLTGEATTRRGEKIKGTVHYVAPEVAKSLPADRRADLYSLGITLYFVVTGKLPYDGGSALSIIKKHIERIPDPPTSVRPDVPEAWGRFILRLIEKDPGRRFATAHEALADLARRLSKPHVVREAQSAAALAPSFVGREPILASLVAALPRPVPKGAGPRASSALPIDDSTVESLPLPKKRRPSLAMAGDESSGSGEALLLQRARAVWLEGEEGSGKTRLVYELRVQAQLQGVPAIVAPCVADGPPPFERLLRLLLTIPGARARLAEAAGAVEALFPGLLGSPPAGLAPAPDDARLLLDRVAEAVLAVARDRPCLLVIEDLRNADETTLSLVGALLRSLALRRGDEPQPLVVLTDRTARTIAESQGPGEAAARSPQEALADALGLLEGRRLLRRVVLGRLDEKATAAMAASMLALPSLDQAFGARLHEATDGNPLFVEELVRSLVDDGVVALRRAPSPTAKIAAPRSLGELLGRRVERLPDDVRAVLLGLAVLGASSPLKVIAQAADRSPAATLDALDLLSRQQMVEREADDEGGPPRHRVTHGLVARTALESADATALVAAHRRALAALEASLEGPARAEVLERLARHADAGGEAGKALGWCTDAGLAALARGNPGRAIDHLGRALDLLRWEQVEQGEERARREVLLLTRLSEALGTVGRLKDAARALEELLALGEERLGPTLAVAVRRRLGDLAQKRGSSAEARRWLQDALERAGPSPELRSERARVLEVMSRGALWRGDYLQVIALASEAAQLFRAAKRDRDAQWALHLWSSAEYYRGRTERAAELLDECLSHASGAAAGKPVEWGPLLEKVGLDAAARAPLETALRAQAGSGRRRREAGDAFGIVLSFSEVATWVDTRADLPTALRFYEASLDGHARLGDAQKTALCLNNLGVYRRQEGRLALALDDLERGLSLHEGSGDRAGSAVALLNIALLRVLLGDADGALVRARRVLTVARELGVSWLAGHCHRAVGRALQLQGAHAEADRELARGVGVFGMVGNVRSTADLLLDRAEVAAAVGRVDEALGHLAKARATGEESRPADFLARARCVEGWLALRPDPRPDLAKAASAFEGALRDALQAEALELRLDAHRGLAHTCALQGALRLAQDHHERAQALEEQALRGVEDELRERWSKTPGAVRQRETTRLLVEKLLDE